MFWICDENSVDNILMFQILLSNVGRVKVTFVSHFTTAVNKAVGGQEAGRGDGQDS